MNNTEKVFMNRDGLTVNEAKEEFNGLREDVLTAIEDGAGYDDVEDILLDYGLEMDYVMDILGIY